MECQILNYYKIVLDIGGLIIYNGFKGVDSMLVSYTVKIFKDKLYNAEIAKQRQNRHDVVFAPLDGKCWRCKKDIYELHEHGDTYTGIDIETATERIVSGCPHCNYSFVD